MKIKVQFEFEETDEFVLNLSDEEIRECLIEDLVDYSTENTNFNIEIIR